MTVRLTPNPVREKSQCDSTQWQSYSNQSLPSVNQTQSHPNYQDSNSQWGLFQCIMDALINQRLTQCQPDFNVTHSSVNWTYFKANQNPSGLIPMTIRFWWDSNVQIFRIAKKVKWDSSQCQWELKARASSQCQSNSNETHPSVSQIRITAKPTRIHLKIQRDSDPMAIRLTPNPLTQKPRSQSDLPHTWLFCCYINNVLRILKCCCCNTGCLISSDLYHQ